MDEEQGIEVMGNYLEGYVITGISKEDLQGIWEMINNVPLPLKRNFYKLSKKIERTLQQV
jgi:hypothetical protein